MGRSGIPARSHYFCRRLYRHEYFTQNESGILRRHSPVPAPPYVPAPVQTKTAASAYTDVLYETLNFLNSAVSQKTANVFDLRSLLSLFLAVRGMRKMIGQNQRPSGPQMLWWATSLMRGRR